jgi:hypothetical protein
VGWTGDSRVAEPGSWWPDPGHGGKCAGSTELVERSGPLCPWVPHLRLGLPVDGEGASPKVNCICAEYVRALSSILSPCLFLWY